MAARLIDGKRIADALRKKLRRRVDRLSGRPGLAIVLIGDNTGSRIYVNLKEKAARELGVYFEKHMYPAGVDEGIIIKLIHTLNQRSEIHGIVVQFPLPEGLSKDKIITAITLVKDVDGFHPDNIKLLLAGRPLIVPGLAEGIMLLLEQTKVALSNKQAVIIANSTIFSEPLGCLLGRAGVRVLVCDPDSQIYSQAVSTADIVIAAVGQPRLITGAMIKPGAIVIDVGYNRINNKAVGDIEFDSVRKKASWLTPVPGGVGPMTVIMLLQNVIRAYELQNQ